MPILADIQALEVDATADLFILDLNPIGEPAIHTFYSGVDENYGELAYQGVSYTPWPIVFDGLEKIGTGPQNRPTFTMSNVTGYMSDIASVRQDLVGAKVTRLRTLVRYLDGGATPDPAAYTTEMYYIDRKKAENKLIMQFEVATAMDFINKQLPGRIMIANTCTWKYRSNECEWPGTDNSKWFDVDGNPVGTSAEDGCGKRLADCRLRFGEGTELPYGGFPTLGKV